MALRFDGPTGRQKRQMRAAGRGLVRIAKAVARARPRQRQRGDANDGQLAAQRNRWMKFSLRVLLFTVVACAAALISALFDCGRHPGSH